MSALTTAAVSIPASRIPCHIVEGETAQPFHHQHPAGHQSRVGPGHHHGPLVGGGQDPGHVEHVVGFEAEVELLHDGLGEQLDQRRRVGQC